MLVLKETLTNDEHKFTLTKFISEEKDTFQLTSETYEGAEIDFTLDERFRVPSGYSVEVHLFKNIYFSQKDIVREFVNF